MLTQGANSFLNKSASIEEIHLVIQELSKRKTFLTPQSQSQILEGIMEYSDIHSYSGVLQRELLFLVSHELTIKEISSCLKLSEKTVQYHRTNLFKKIGVKNMVGLAIHAYASNIYFDVSLLEKFAKWIHPKKASAS